MRDVFLAYVDPDHGFACGLSDSLRRKGLILGDPISLWPGMPLLRLVDGGLAGSRRAVVIVSREFLYLGYSRKELDSLADRSEAVCLLYGVEEREVGEFSEKLAIVAIPGSFAEQLVRLLRWSPGPSGGSNGRPRRR
jgi:hypothetical protein